MVNLLRRLVVPLVALGALAACGGDDGDGAATSLEEAPATLAPSTPQEPTGTETTTAADLGTVAPDTTGATTAGGTAGGPVSGDFVELLVNADDTASHGQVLPVELGQTVVLRLFSDTDREYHVHGFDLEVRAPAGTEQSFELVADTPGRFEVEDHVADQVIAVLEVQG